MVVAPEHERVEGLTTPEQKEVIEEYCRRASLNLNLTALIWRKKNRSLHCSYAINPVNGEQIPIWIADYVLSTYGTGAIMAVPAHDDRDFEFAKQYNLPIKRVVAPSPDASDSTKEASESDLPFTEVGIAVNSGEYDGTSTDEFKSLITANLADAGLGRKSVNYKLRDWLFSRQHFWGEPFPLLHELGEDGEPNGVILALDPSELPLDLPEGVTFDANKRSPDPPLEHAPKEWLYVERNGKKYKRETNTMPQMGRLVLVFPRYLIS